MTGDVEEECSLLQISQLDDTVSCSTIQPSSTAFINSNMAVEDTCIYTATIPTELAGNFPEGSVLQIMPDSAIVAVAVKNLPTSDENSVVFKENSFTIENVQTSLNLPNLLTESNHNNQSQTIDVSVCPEENIDIDLSFLNEAENAMIPDPKCLNANTVELQSMIADESSQSLNLLQNSLPTESAKSLEEQASSETLKDSVDDSANVVMIDVTKPIQLSQNSLIMVNGQKCVLQHDTQTGQVIAYPVKEQEKPRRRRGRPRKASVEQTSQEAEQNEGKTITDVENISEEEREKGLLDIVNDDGDLVRRSSRKRKKAKVLRDYETGNLKQELGSDIEDVEAFDKDAESHKKKSRGPGRPRKFTPERMDTVSATKRNRGRPKKVSSECEPTQAFLVQTADGQALMMQVPLSSIPPGISLQEMAQEIANKLNLGLNQATDTPVTEMKDSNPKGLKNESVLNTAEAIVPMPEVALQDHSVGSTTNFPGLQADLTTTDENSVLVGSSCQDVINNINQSDIVCETEEVIFESENCIKEVTIPSDLSVTENNLNTLEVPQCSEDRFSINLPSTTTSADSTSMYGSFDPLTDHDFCIPRSNASEFLKNNIESAEDAELSKNIFNKSDVMKDNISSHSQSIPIQELSTKNLSTDNPSELILNSEEFCETADSHKPIEQMPNVKNFSEITKYDSVNNEAKTILEKNCIQIENIIGTITGSDLIQVEFSNAPETVRPVLQVKSPQFIKPGVLNSENQSQPLEVFLSIDKLSSSFKSSDNTAVSSTSTTVIPVSDKDFPGQIINGAKLCKICQMPYLKDEEIIEHFKAKHPKCICIECNYMNEHPYVIKRHALRHVNQGCICKLCNKKYKDMYILKMHIKMVHLPPDVLYACEICDKKFTRKAHLKRHLRIHAPVKQYQCPHCDYKGCEKSDITKHILIHEEPKFKCEICGKAFRHVKNKDLHLKRHSGQRDYKCAACGFFGYTYTDIRKHIERRHSVSCPQCKQIFADSELLKEHRRMGSCQSAVLDQNSEIKVLENPSIAIVSTEAAFSEEMPLDILDQPQVMAISECSEETLSALQNGQLVMTSVEGILDTQNGHLIIEGLEDSNVLSPDNPSVISVEKDAEKMVTVMTVNGPLRNISLPLKSLPSSLPLDSIMATVDSSFTESCVISSETEVTS